MQLSRRARRGGPESPGRREERRSSRQPSDGGRRGDDRRQATSDDPILIGISAAQTGILAPYDLQSGQLLQMRIDQINAAGGVLGRRSRPSGSTRSRTRRLAATNAEELIDKGAVVIVATCDFDFSFPAINAAGGHEVPGLALCASSPKVATPDIVGPYGGSMGLGSDAEGVAMAEWLRTNKPEIESMYVFRDESLEYSKATADYFKAKWEELGGHGLR